MVLIALFFLIALAIERANQRPAPSTSTLRYSPVTGFIVAKIIGVQDIRTKKVYYLLDHVITSGVRRTADGAIKTGERFATIRSLVDRIAQLDGIAMVSSASAHDDPDRRLVDLTDDDLDALEKALNQRGIRWKVLMDAQRESRR